MSEVKRPLEGVKVVELATFIAAPCCARFLADLGAEVIKVEAPAGDPLRYTAVNEGRPQDQKENTSYDLENAGKTCVCLNTKTAAGREALEKLIAGADIFITNWRQTPLKKAALDYDTLHAKYPKLVYGFVSGYGEKGPDKDLPGFDFTAFFARGGVLGTLFDKDSLPMLTIAGFGDHQVGMYLASGVLAALYRARETGIGDRVVVSLFHSAIWDVSLILQASQYGDPTTQYPLSRRTLPNPLVVAHKTKDGKWLQIAMPQYNRHYPIFMRAIGHPELAEDPRYYPQTNLQANIEEFYDFLVKEMASPHARRVVQADGRERPALRGRADVGSAPRRPSRPGPPAASTRWSTPTVPSARWCVLPSSSRRRSCPPTTAGRISASRPRSS